MSLFCRWQIVTFRGFFVKYEFIHGISKHIPKLVHRVVSFQMPGKTSTKSRFFHRLFHRLWKTYVGNPPKKMNVACILPSCYALKVGYDTGTTSKRQNNDISMTKIYFSTPICHLDATNCVKSLFHRLFHSLWKVGVENCKLWILHRIFSETL